MRRGSKRHNWTNYLAGVCVLSGVFGLVWSIWGGALVTTPAWNGIYWRWTGAACLLILVAGAAFIARNRPQLDIRRAGDWFAPLFCVGLLCFGASQVIDVVNAFGKGPERAYSGTVTMLFSTKASDSSHIGDSFGEMVGRILIVGAMGRTYTVAFADAATREPIEIAIPKDTYRSLAPGDPITVRLRPGLLGIPYRRAADDSGALVNVKPPMPLVTPLPRPGTVTQGKAGIEWVSIPEGSFMMGSPANEDEGPAHIVAIPAFEMARSAVTNKQYRACVTAGVCSARQDFGAAFSGDEQPVVGVGYEDARTFSQWAGGRLPSEAQREYAARSAGQNWRFPWGDDAATCDRAVVGTRHYMVPAPACGRPATWPVCSKPAGNSAQGVCDLAGNTLEWVEDWYQEIYSGAPTDGSSWQERQPSWRPRPSVVRAVRGGCWTCPTDSQGWATFRWYASPEDRNRSTSFRPVR